MKEEIKDKTASVKARLLNISREMKVDFDALLLRYFQERFLYRLMLSEFSNHFILKGGFLLRQWKNFGMLKRVFGMIFNGFFLHSFFPPIQVLPDIFS
jgi:hypothetical protein